MKQFIELVKRVKNEGRSKKDRTGTGTKSIFGHQMRFNMADGFPLLQLKKTHTKSIFIELLWFLGNHMKDSRYSKLPMTNIKFLTDNKVTIWNEWADKNGNLGPVYGKQWVEWEKTNVSYDAFNEEIGPDIETIKINQIQVAIDRLISNPEDRGNIVSAWNVGELKNMALRPCHALFQFYAEELTIDERITWCSKQTYFEPLDFPIGKEVNNHEATEEVFKSYECPKYRLSLQLYQRSADLFLGVPFNIASYSLLLHMVAQVTNMVPHEFVWTGGDVHLYNNHMEQVEELLKVHENLPNEIYHMQLHGGVTEAFKVPDRKIDPPLPRLELNKEVSNIFDFKYEDIKITGDSPLSNIKAPIAI